MDRLVQALVAWGVLSAAGAWAWWVSEHRVNEVVGGVVLIVVLVGAFGVYLAVDRKRHGLWLCFGGYGALVLVAGVHAWFNGLLPIVSASSWGAYSAYVDRLGGWGEFLLVAPLPALFIGAILWVDVVVKSLDFGGNADRRPRAADSDLYGRARFLDRRYMRELAKRRGILLGSWGERVSSPLLGWVLEGSALTIAPPRTGKGAVIALNLLSPGRRGPGGSTVVIDPRGEMWCVVARRRREMGRRLVLIDPFGVIAEHARKYPGLHLPRVESARYNPLDFIREDEGLAVQDIQSLVEGILTPPGSQSTNRHFYESASAIIAGYVSYVRFCEEPLKRNLKRVHELLSMGPKEHAEFLEGLDDKAAEVAGGLFHLAVERQQRVGSQEGGSNFSTIANQLQFMISPDLVRHTGASSFDPCDLGKGNMDIFVVAPERMIEQVRGWLRLWISIPNAVADREVMERDLMIFIDEMPTLGYLKPVMDGYAMAAGKGVHFWCFAQSLSALESSWGKENCRTIVDLAELVQVLGFPRIDTVGAESFSKAMGTATFEARTESRSGSVSGDRALTGNTQSQEGDSRAYARERLVTPDDLMTLGPRDQYVIAAGKDMPRDALYLNQARYWEHKETKKLADANPLVVRKKRAAENAA